MHGVDDELAERILTLLSTSGALSYEGLIDELGDVNWTQLSLTLDKLTRHGKVTVWRTDVGESRVIGGRPRRVSKKPLPQTV